MAYRLLVVEDDPAVRSLLCDLLGQAGYEVQAVEDGVEALTAVVDRLPDVILSDVLMPRMSGLELCALLKEHPRTRQVPVVFLTCLDDPVQAFDVGADDFIPKPFRPAELLARVQALLRRVTSPPEVQAEGLRGKFTELPLPDLLQALKLAGASGCLTAVRQGTASRARLWMTEGRLAAGVLEGERAALGRTVVLELAEWEEGSFAFDSSEAAQWESTLAEAREAADWSIHDSLEGLLLDAMLHLDEQGEQVPVVKPEVPADFGPPEETPAALAASAAQPASTDVRPLCGSQVDTAELARRIDEFRNRLKLKAFQAFVEGRGPVIPGLALPGEPQPDVALPPEVDSLIDRLLGGES